MRPARPLRAARHECRGQSLIEGALTLGLIIGVALASFALAVRIVAEVQFESAVANAAASTIAVPLGSGDRAQRYAQDAFIATLRAHAYLAPGRVTCVSQGYFGSGDAATAGQLIICSADATLLLRDFPVPIGPNVTLHASASVVQPAYRQCDSVTSTSGATCR